MQVEVEADEDGTTFGVVPASVQLPFDSVVATHGRLPVGLKVTENLLIVADQQRWSPGR